MIREILTAGLSDQGKVRSTNEDRCYFRVVHSSDESPTGLFIVADGLGGRLAGEVASHWTVETFKREMAEIFKPLDPLATQQVRPQDLWNPTDPSATRAQAKDTNLVLLIKYATQRANEVLLNYARQKPGQARGLSSTMVVAVIRDGLATVANLGDSRAYLWRLGQLYQLTTDHSLSGELVARGQLSPEMIAVHPNRNLLHRCLGCSILVEPDIPCPVALEPGDRLLLCSDGLWGMVTPAQQIRDLLGQESSVRTVCQNLVQAANDAGGDDNVTAVTIQVTD